MTFSNGRRSALWTRDKPARSVEFENATWRCASHLRRPPSRRRRRRDDAHRGLLLVGSDPRRRLVHHPRRNHDFAQLSYGLGAHVEKGLIATWPTHFWVSI